MEDAVEDGDPRLPHLVNILIKSRRAYRERRQGEALMETPRRQAGTTRIRRTTTGSSQRTPPSRSSGASELHIQARTEDQRPIDAPALLPSQHIERSRAHTPYQEVPSYTYPQLWPGPSQPNDQRLPPLGDFVAQFGTGPGSSIGPHPHRQHVQQHPSVGLEESYARYAWDDFMNPYPRP